MSETKYAECITCGADLATPADKERHLEETFTRLDPPEVKGGMTITGLYHGYRVLNPTREERVRSAVDRAVDRALERFCDDLDDDIRRGALKDLTDEEITAALGSYPDFQDAWENWLAEGAA